MVSDQSPAAASAAQPQTPRERAIAVVFQDLQDAEETLDWKVLYNFAEIAVDAMQREGWVRA